MSVERRFFTKYPDKSLEHARGLIERHGQPVEICIAENHDVRVAFRDGARYILGGFTVGYRGTGPDYTARLLGASGFSVTIDEIAEMEPPVTLIPGQPYISASTAKFWGATVEEAQDVARDSIPAGARVLASDVFARGGQDTVVGEGSSKEAALEEVRIGLLLKRLPEGVVDLPEPVLEETTAVVEGRAYSERFAFEDAQRALEDAQRMLRIPAGARVNQREIVQEGSKGTVSVSAFSKKDAEEAAKVQALEGASILEIACTRPPSRGILGWRRRPGTYRVTWGLHWVVRVTCAIWRATVTYMHPAAIKVKFIPPSL